LRLPREVIDHFRATGKGWQAQIGEVLVRHVSEATGRVGRVAEGREAFGGEGEEGGSRRGR
jgi:hypothetical protein